MERKMVLKKWVLVSLTFLGFLLFLDLNLSAEQVSLKLSPESKLYLNGNSTLHSYSSTATKIDGWIELEFFGSESSIAQIIQEGQAKRAEIAIAVNGLKSGKSRLDKNMYESLKAVQYPQIHFNLKKYEIDSSFPLKNGKPFSMKITGQLTVAGKENVITLETNGRFIDNRLKIWGSKELFMTDFGIEPPIMFFGTLKTDNRVVVHFDLLFGLEGPASKIKKEEVQKDEN